MFFEGMYYLCGREIKLINENLNKKKIYYDIVFR